jgi:hypothetical protein
VAFSTEKSNLGNNEIRFSATASQNNVRDYLPKMGTTHFVKNHFIENHKVN